MATKKRKPSRSGSQVTHAEHLARGEKKLAGWLPGGTLDLLDAECERSGFSRMALLDEVIRMSFDPTHPEMLSARHRELIRELIRAERGRRATARAAR